MYQIQTSHIHNLSDDILMMLFLHFPAIPASWYRESVTTTASDEIVPDFTWMYITHVCRRWRNVSLGCSLIWTHINFMPPSWTPVFLERARQAPLRVDVDWRRDGSRHYIDDAVAMTLKHLHHTRHIVFVNPPAKFLVRAIPILQQQVVDKLEVLGLYQFDPPVSPSLGPEVLRTAFELPDALFSGPAPRLDHLAIKGLFNLSWRSQLFSSRLTHLHLDKRFRSAIHTTDQLLEYLRSCRLEEMKLEGCLPRRSMQIPLAPLPESYSLVHIPILKIFEIVDIAVEVADLYRRLRIPVNCRIILSNRHIWHRDSVSMAASSEALATEVELALAARPAFQDPELHVFQRYHDCVWYLFELGSSATSSRVDTVVRRPSFTLTLSSRPGPTTMDEVRRNTEAIAGIISRVTPLYHLDALRKLSISSRPASPISFDTWLVTLRELRRLNVLQVQGICCYDFATVFAILSDDRQMLPSLQKLAVSHAHLSYPLGPRGLAIALESAFDTRSRIGAPALDIMFESCHVSPAQLQKLEKASGQKIEVLGDPDSWGVGEDHEEDEVSAMGDSQSAEESGDDD